MLLNKAGFNSNLINPAKIIDKYYIPTRYTDVWSEGVPEDYYTLDEANQAINNTGAIISGVEDKWRLLKKG